MASHTVKCAETKLKWGGRFIIYARACHPGGAVFQVFGGRAPSIRRPFWCAGSERRRRDCFTLELSVTFKIVKVSVSYTSQI